MIDSTTSDAQWLTVEGILDPRALSPIPGSLLWRHHVRNKLQLTHSETARALRNAIIVLISFSFVSQFLFDMLVKCSSGKYLQPRCSLASVVIVARRRTARDLFGAVVLRDADNTGIASH